MEREVREMQQHPTTIEMIQAPGGEVYAGTEILLQVQVTCTEKCALQGGQVRIIDEQGAVVKDVAISITEEETNATEEFKVKMPEEPGSYCWAAEYLEQEGEAVQHEGSSVLFTFTVIPHKIATSVWGVPIPVMLGGEFTVKVGAKCSAGCSLAGLPYTIYDEQGQAVRTGQLGEEPLSQTSGLMWAEEELVAPDEEGLYTWRVECQVGELELAHQASASNFRLKTARAPEHTVTVEVVDMDRKTPLKGASVYVHPYRSQTDEQGQASLQVTTGTHELYVKLKDYDGYQTTLEVGGDLTVQVEMFWVPDPYA